MKTSFLQSLKARAKEFYIFWKQNFFFFLFFLFFQIFCVPLMVWFVWGDDLWKISSWEEVVLENIGISLGIFLFFSFYFLLIRSLYASFPQQKEDYFQHAYKKLFFWILFALTFFILQITSAVLVRNITQSW